VLFYLYVMLILVCERVLNMKISIYEALNTFGFSVENCCAILDYSHLIQK
jgi:hypothetical protein